MNVWSVHFMLSVVSIPESRANLAIGVQMA